MTDRRAVTPADLAELPHFRELPAAGLARLAAVCRAREGQAGELLFREGQSAERFYAVLAGAVSVFRLRPDGREQQVHRIGPGRLLAEAAVLQFGHYPASARIVATPTRLIAVHGDGFRALLASEPALATAMIGGLSLWLHLLLDRIDVLTRASAGARLAAWLLAAPARGAGDRAVVELALPKRQLAAELSLTPETLSRLLRRWSDAGWIAVAGRRITLRDPEALLVAADGSVDAPRRATARARKPRGA